MAPWLIASWKNSSAPAPLGNSKSSQTTSSRSFSASFGKKPQFYFGLA